MPLYSRNTQPTSPWDVFVMFWILRAAIAAASVPIIIGMGVTALTPWVSHLRTLTPWLLLHFLWMYPVLWAVSLVSGPTLKYLFATGPARKAGEALDNLIGFLALALMYTVFFHDILGTIVAALVSGILMKFVVERLENRKPPTESTESHEV